MSADHESESKSTLEHRFVCSRCGEEAGLLQLVVEENRAEIVRTSFTSRLTARLSYDSTESVQEAILKGDVHALYALDFEYVPFFCPECDACYCRGHWIYWHVFDEDGWHDSIRGRCPEGHERMLED